MNATGILSAIGFTPTIRLERLFPEYDNPIYTKLEYLNPSGSVKDRTSFTIIQEAFKSGHINSETIIIESTSGNMGVGLAQICKYFGLRLILVVDPLINAATKKLLEIYGAEIHIVHQADESGTYLGARLAHINELQEKYTNSFWTNQYSNPNTLLAHQRTIGELVSQISQPLDYLFMATSTCGTVMGCAQEIKRRNLTTKVIPVDALGSKIFSDQSGIRKIPGMGASRKSDFLDSSILEKPIHIDDLGSIEGCRKLMDREAILAGGSTGAVVTAIGKSIAQLPTNASIAFIIADRGERYLDTIYSEKWVKENINFQELTTIIQ
jgi:N-(2-amino-2-carboxyethyl)-L-glutamate synthase